ncbi:DUF1013 domain-containing protein [Candidatus Hepatincolaceae symbiont of Richtersius coronifer]
MQTPPLNQTPLNPKAVAIWLVENTSLTFEQIANFCGFHVLEVEALANEEINKSLRGLNPITTGETTEEEIERCQKDPQANLKYFESEEYSKYKSAKKILIKQSKFKRKTKPECILWVLNHYPQINDYQISKLLGSTINVVKSIRSKSYWNYNNLSPKNPVTEHLCTEEALFNLIHPKKLASGNVESSSTGQIEETTPESKVGTKVKRPKKAKA